MANVTVISGAPIDGASRVAPDGVTVYEWGFSVNVNGQVGVYFLWFDSNDPADYDELKDDVIEILEENPGDLEGIGENDSPGDGPGDDDGDDDSAVASGDGSDYGDSA
jgi:hypothetical protein